MFKFAFLLFSVGLFMFFVGIHNIDIATNMMLLDEWEFDKSPDGTSRTANEVYLMGLFQCNLSIIFFIGSFFIMIPDSIKINKT